MRIQSNWVFTAVVLVALTISLFSVTASAQTIIKIDGSMGSMPLVQALAKVFQAKQPNIVIEFGKGSNPKTRIDALVIGTIDIALASHGLNIDALTQQGMQVTEIARTAVVFAANTSGGPDSLTNDQICGIFAGSVVNWESVGGTDLAIAARARPENEVDTEVARDGVSCLRSLAFAPNVKIVQRGSDMTKDLAEIKGAIGMTTTTVVEQSGGRIKALALNGVVANEANVSVGRYHMVREVFLVAKGFLSPAIHQFIAFIRSPEGSAIMRANGAFPTNGPS